MPHPTVGQTALLDALSDSLKVPLEGGWYLVSAYIKRAPAGGSVVTALSASPVLSYREQRVVDESVLNDADAPF